MADTPAHGPRHAARRKVGTRRGPDLCSPEVVAWRSAQGGDAVEDDNPKTSRIISAGDRLKWAAGVVAAIALAIAAVIALWPKPDERDNASITGIELHSRIPLTEYKQRVASEHAQVGGSALRGAATARPAAVLVGRVLSAQAETTETGTTDTGTTDTGTTHTGTTHTGTTDTGTTHTGTTDTGTTDTGTTDTGTTDTGTTGPQGPSDSAPVLKPGSPVVLPTGLDRASFSDRFKNEVLPELQANAASSGQPPITVLPIRVACDDPVASTCPLGDAASAAMQDENGGAVSPEKAAQRIAGLLRQTRTISVQTATHGIPAGSRDYLGALVSVAVRLEGLRGRRVFLRWSIWDIGNQHRLYGDWLADNLAYRLKADTNDDKAALDLWIPMPKNKGRYYVRITLDDEHGVHLDQKRTHSFK